MFQPSNTENDPVNEDVIEPEQNADLEDTATKNEGIIHEVYEKEYLQESPELQMKVDSKKITQRYLPKQIDLNKMLKII